jgi:hypothetical protein
MEGKLNMNASDLDKCRKRILAPTGGKSAGNVFAWRTKAAVNGPTELSCVQAALRRAALPQVTPALNDLGLRPFSHFR